jgi:hypothetical protein
MNEIVSGKTFHVKNTRDGMPVVKQLIASFNGTGFTAEREDDMLNIFLVSGENVSTNTVGDRSRARDAPGADTMAKMFAGHAKAREALDHACGCKK